MAADPEDDLVAIELELVMGDLASVEQRLDRQRRAARSGDKEIAAEVQALERALAVLQEGTPVHRSSLGADDRARLAPVFLLTAKPLLLVANTGEQAGTDVKLPDRAVAVPIDIEAEIAACAPEDRDEMRETYGLGESALDTVAHSAYHLLGRRTFLTTGEDESRAWTFRSRGQGARVRGCHPLGPAARVHPRRGDPLGRVARDRFLEQGPGAGEAARRG